MTNPTSESAKPVAEEAVMHTPDWQPVRDGLEAAYARLGYQIVRFDGGAKYPTRDWNLAVVLRDLFSKYLTDTFARCWSCKKELNFHTVYRCADCDGKLCKDCIKVHFGENHRPHPVAPIAQTSDARELLIECRTELADMLSELTSRGYKQRHIDASLEFIAKLDAAIAAIQRETK